MVGFGGLDQIPYRGLVGDIGDDGTGTDLVGGRHERRFGDVADHDGGCPLVKRRASARPMPAAPPVITQTVPSSSIAATSVAVGGHLRAPPSDDGTICVPDDRPDRLFD